MRVALDLLRVPAKIVEDFKQVSLANALRVGEDAVVGPVVLIDGRRANDLVLRVHALIALEALKADHLRLPIRVNGELMVSVLVGCLCGRRIRVLKQDGQFASLDHGKCRVLAKGWLEREAELAPILRHEQVVRVPVRHRRRSLLPLEPLIELGDLDSGGLRVLSQVTPRRELL